jgi:hypothetical protein
MQQQANALQFATKISAANVLLLSDAILTIALAFAIVMIARFVVNARASARFIVKGTKGIFQK